MQQNMSQNTGQPQQPFMPEPPQTVTVKDSLYLTDMLSWNLIAAKKAHFYANQVQDQEIKQALHRAGQMHQQHYERILARLQTHNGQQMGSNH